MDRVSRKTAIMLMMLEIKLMITGVLVSFREKKIFAIILVEEAPIIPIKNQPNIAPVATVSAGKNARCWKIILTI